MKNNDKKQGLLILWARVRVWAFQMRHIVKGQMVWQEEIYKEQLRPGGRQKITYVGACKIPPGARWPYDARITRVSFYNRPPLKVCHVRDEHATQHH